MTETVEYCDRCGVARATEAFTLPEEKGGGRLVFCGHHSGAHREALVASGASVVDLTEAPVTVSV